MSAMILNAAATAAPALPAGIAAAPADLLPLQDASGLPALADFAALLLQQIGLQDDAGNPLPLAADDADGADAAIAAAVNDLAAMLPALAALPGAAPADPAAAVAPADAALLSAFLDAARALAGLPSAVPPGAPGAPADAALASGDAAAAATAPAAAADAGLPAIVAGTDKVAADAQAATTRAADLPLAAATDPLQLPPSHTGAAAVRSDRAAEAPPLNVATPVGSRGWDAEVGQRLVWMVNRNEGRAELTLTPPQMGRIEVTLTTSGDQTSAYFVAASPAAREALENALPRLRELLADAGVTLGQASVSADNPRGGEDAQGGAGRGSRAMALAGDAATADAPRWVQRGSGMIDTFA